MNATLTGTFADHDELEEIDALTATHAVIDGQLYRHYNAKRSPKTGRAYKRPQPGDIEREPYDRSTGHHLHWRPCFREAYGDQKAFRTWDNPSQERPQDGVYHLDYGGDFVWLREV